jgi:hypothetical protein
VVEISGGLGNQLFQLAAAKNLDNQGYKVFIDSIYNEINGFRVTEINDFASALEIPAVKRSLFLINLLKMPIVKKIYISKLRKKTIYEKINFEKPIIPINNMNFRLFGYWQNISLANEIRNNVGSSSSLLIKQKPFIPLGKTMYNFFSEVNSMFETMKGLESNTDGLVINPINAPYNPHSDKLKDKRKRNLVDNPDICKWKPGDEYTIDLKVVQTADKRGLFSSRRDENVLFKGDDWRRSGECGIK